MFKTNNLNINHKIFQGNSVSSFFIALSLLSIEHKNIAYEYKTTTKN